MKKAALAGSITALGIFLAIWAVFQEVRLDWPETALVIGISCFISGCMLFGQVLHNVSEDM